MRDPRDRHKPSCITLHICCNEYYIPVPYTVLDINRNFGCPNLCQVLPGTYINSSMVWYIIFRRRLVRQTLLQLQKSSHTNSKQFVPDSVGVFLKDLSLPHPTLPTQPVPYMISTVLAKDTLSKNQSAGPMTGGSATAGVPIKAQADSMKSCAKT